MVVGSEREIDRIGGALTSGCPVQPNVSKYLYYGGTEKIDT